MMKIRKQIVFNSVRNNLGKGIKRDAGTNIHPILGLNLEVFPNQESLTKVGHSKELGWVDMEYDLEDDPIEGGDGKKRPIMVFLDSNVSNCQDLLGAIEK